MSYNAIDLFSGCGGMTEGLIISGFHVVAAVEIDNYAAEAYRANHTQHGVTLFETDIRQLRSDRILELLNGEPLHLLAGCPPCQGFSSLRKKTRKGHRRIQGTVLFLSTIGWLKNYAQFVLCLKTFLALKTTLCSNVFFLN